MRASLFRIVVMQDDDTLSLRQHLVNWLFTPLFLLLLFSTVTGYISAVNLSNQPYDLVLIERARLLAEHYSASQDDRFDELFADPANTFRFALRDLKGQRLAGQGQLPTPRPADYQARAPKLRDTQFRGEKLRLATLRIDTHRGLSLLVQAAEPVSARQSLGRSILANVVIPQFIFIVVAGVAVWFGLKRGFEPLERLRREVASRPRDDLRPLDAGRAPAEVRPLIGEVNALIARLRSMIDAQRRFVADAAHQLRTPFAGLKAQAELAKREQVSTPVHDALERICTGAARCSRLVNQLLTLARNEPQARYDEPLGVIDLNRIAQDCAAHWVPEALLRGIDLGFEASEQPLKVQGDEAALRDLIDNLIDNATRYTPSGGRVTVRTGDHVGAWLEVEDNGPGIPADQRERVFERFHRVGGSGQPGSGLGLAIVREVAMLHGAHIEILDAPGGQGARFLVRFPEHAGPEE